MFIYEYKAKSIMIVPHKSKINEIKCKLKQIDKHCIILLVDKKCL